MKFDIITIFPEMCAGPLGESMMGKARERRLIEIAVHDLRDWANDKHRTVDDEPYGGGQGMVMKCEPIFAAVNELKREETKVILMTPQGTRLNQAGVRRLAGAGQGSHYIILCGHYEGVDHRVVEALVDEEISIGDYVLTNGAIAANILVDAIVRLIPGVLGDERSPEEESFSEGLLEAPHYTRPGEFEGMKVPDVLLSGDHGKIAAWREEQGVARTRANRPDLLEE